MVANSYRASCSLMQNNSYPRKCFVFFCLKITHMVYHPLLDSHVNLGPGTVDDRF